MEQEPSAEDLRQRAEDQDLEERGLSTSKDKEERMIRGWEMEDLTEVSEEDLEKEKEELLIRVRMIEQALEAKRRQ